MSSKVLYWPGRGKNLEVLADFRDVLIKNGYVIDYVPMEYDVGTNPFVDPSEWVDFLSQGTWNWWIGISLGAALSYFAASLLEAKMRPTRMTLINPFASRKVLSSEKGFSLAKQWDFSPISFVLDINHIDIVLSVKDEKISNHHGIELFSAVTGITKQIIRVDADHCLNNTDAQIELASYLLDWKGENNGWKYICSDFCKRV